MANVISVQLRSLVGDWNRVSQIYSLWLHAYEAQLARLQICKSASAAIGLRCVQEESSA